MKQKCALPCGTSHSTLLGKNLVIVVHIFLSFSNLQVAQIFQKMSFTCPLMHRGIEFSVLSSRQVHYVAKMVETSNSVVRNTTITHILPC